MTFSVLDGKRSWHLNPPIFTPDRSHCASLVLSEVAVPGTPEGQCSYPHPDPTHHPSAADNSSLTRTPPPHLHHSPCSSNSQTFSPASASWVLELQGCAATSGYHNYPEDEFLGSDLCGLPAQPRLLLLRVEMKGRVLATP